MPAHTPKAVENYTSAFLWMSLVILFFTFWIMTALWGFFAVVASAFAIDRTLLWRSRGKPS